MITQQKSSRTQGWAGIPSRGKTALRFVELDVKVNTDHYINKILKLFLSSSVPR